MKSKLLSLLLACCLVLTACSDPSSAKNGSPEEDGTESEQNTNEAETTESEPQKESESKAENPYPEFKGIELTENGLAYSTLKRSNWFCYGGDTVYFSNPDDDRKLYSYDGETAECLTEINAYRLNYYDGSVYFLSSSDKLGIYDSPPGKIYRYDTESGELTQINDNTVTGLCVDEHGFFYSKNEDEKNYVYELDPLSGEEERFCEGERAYFIDEYIIKSEQNDDGTQNWLLENDKEKIYFIYGENAVPDFVHDGIFYYTDGENYDTYFVNLCSGERGSLPVGISYTVCGDEMFYSTQGIGSGLFKYVNGESERMELHGEKHFYFEGEELMLPMEERDTTLYTLRELYSDGRSLYALAQPSNNLKTRYMAKLETKEVNIGGEKIELTYVRLLGNKTSPKTMWG